MRNMNPTPVKCAVCDSPGSPSAFTSGRLDKWNWIESGGRAYMVCNMHIGDVQVSFETNPIGHVPGPVFSTPMTTTELERRIEYLEARLGV